MRTPAKVLDSPDQLPVLFELEVEDSDSPSADTATEAASSSSSLAVATPRLSYLVSGPGASDSWAAVPAVPRAEWEDLLALAGDDAGSGTSASSSASSSSSSGGQGGGGSGGDGGFVWGLELEDLDDGEYRLQVCD